MKIIFKLMICAVISIGMIQTNFFSIKAADKRDELSGNGFYDIADGKSREVYNSLYREATYRLYDGGSTLYTASARQGNNFFVNGSYMYAGGYAIRELIDVNGQRLVIDTSCPMYSEPFAEDAFYLGYMEPGTYQVTRQSLDFYELTYNGRTVWAETISPSYYQGTSAYLDTDTIEGIPLNKLIPSYGESIRPGIGMKPQYVTIHNTANEGWGANANNHANYLYNGESRKDFTSWHFTVDNTEIWQSIPMNESAFHAGDGFGMGNTSTVAIEIAENADGDYQQAEKNAAALTAYILKENGLPADAIALHQNWSGKHCAHNILDETKGSMGWNAFKAEVARIYNTLGQPESVSLNPSAATLSIGKSFSLTAYVKPAGVNTDITYTSSNEGVASVSFDGTVKALKAGKANITVRTSNGKTATCVVNVIPQPASITTNPKSALLSVNQTFQLKAYVQPSNANQNVTYRSSNANIASISSSGNVIAKAPGAATITITASNGVKTTMVVTVLPALTINPPAARLSVGKSFQANAIVYPERLNGSIKYSVSNSDIIQVSADGTVRAKAPGEAYLYASVGGISKKSTITVIPVPERVTLNPSSASVFTGSTFKAKAYVQPIKANQDVTFSSSDTTIATVRNDGSIKAIHPGTATITARASNGVTGSFTINVYEKK